MFFSNNSVIIVYNFLLHENIKLIIKKFKKKDTFRNPKIIIPNPSSGPSMSHKIISLRNT